MKKIFTLASVLLISLITFADFAPTRLNVSAYSNSTIKVTVDGNEYNSRNYNNSVVFENLNPGHHNVRIYELQQKRGLFSKRTEYVQIFSGSIMMRPMHETTLVLNRTGRASITEQKMRGRNNNGRDNDRYDDRNDRNNRDNRDGRGRGGYDDRNSGYGNDRGYGQLMSSASFNDVLRTMQRESFDNTRLSIAKQVADRNSLSSSQVREMVRTLSFENSKIEFAKYAYRGTVDKNNYYIVNDAFSFSNSRDELANYIRSYR